VVDVEVEWVKDGAGHVVDDYIRLRATAFNVRLELVKARDLLAIFGAAGGPKVKMAATFAQFGHGFTRPFNQAEVLIDQGEIDINEDVGVFHVRVGLKIIGETIFLSTDFHGFSERLLRGLAAFVKN
jgi:hypothetical protein